jgi:hypothetical protein
MNETDGRVKLVPYRGKKLLSLDFSLCGFEEAEKIVANARSFIDKQAPKSLLTFVDFTRAVLEPRLVALIGQFALANEPFVKAGATVGLMDAQRLILDAVNKIAKRNIRTFSDPVKAKNWLVEQG